MIPFNKRKILALVEAWIRITLGLYPVMMVGLLPVTQLIDRYFKDLSNHDQWEGT